MKTLRHWGALLLGWISCTAAAGEVEMAVNRDLPYAAPQEARRPLDIYVGKG